MPTSVLQGQLTDVCIQTKQHELTIFHSIVPSLWFKHLWKKTAISKLKRKKKSLMINFNFNFETKPSIHTVAEK